MFVDSAVLIWQYRELLSLFAPCPIISLSRRLLSWVWKEKYSLRNNKGSVSQTHFLNTKAASRPHTEAERKPHPLVCWSHADPRSLPVLLLHTLPTPPSQHLFVGQWCSRNDAAMAVAFRGQLGTRGERRSSPRTTAQQQQWQRRKVQAWSRLEEER